MTKSEQHIVLNRDFDTHLSDVKYKGHYPYIFERAANPDYDSYTSPIKLVDHKVPFKSTVTT